MSETTVMHLLFMVWKVLRCITATTVSLVVGYVGWRQLRRHVSAQERGHVDGQVSNLDVQNGPPALRNARARSCIRQSRCRHGTARGSCRLRPSERLTSLDTWAKRRRLNRCDCHVDVVSTSKAIMGDTACTVLSFPTCSPNVAKIKGHRSAIRESPFRPRPIARP